MTSQAAFQFQRSMPVLQVQDLAKSLAFYCDTLGFVSHGAWGEPPVFAIVQRGLVTLALDRSRDDSPAPRQQYWHAYIYVSDADALLSELKAQGVAIERDIETTEYGCRDFDVRDPDGHIICFGQVIQPGARGPGLADAVGRDADVGAGTSQVAKASEGPWSGGCQCGAVRFRAARLGRASHCHCRMCQKAFGGIGGALVTAGELVWTRGQLRHFRSSNAVKRGFCGDCGTPLTFEVDGGAVDVAIAAFDRPGDITPVSQLARASRLAWFDSLHRLPEPQISEQAQKADWYRTIVSRQHPDHDTDAWPTPEEQP